MGRMDPVTAADLEQLGRDLAQQVGGAGVVEQVEVRPGEDSTDRPVYFFSFLINQDRLQENLGLFRIRLSQMLKDELDARGDEHYPSLELLDKIDGNRRTRA